MAIEAPLWMDPNPATGVGPEYSARQDRGIIGALFTEGVADVQAGDLAVTQRAAGANMTVTVAPGVGYVVGDDVARQGTYRVVVTTPEIVIVPAAPSSGSRIDLVVLRVYDASAIGGSRNAAFVEILTGTPGSSPSAPNLPSTAIPLARVTVAAGSSSVVNANIADARAQSGANVLRVGTQAQPMTQTQRDALSGSELFAGRMVENTTSGTVEHYTGSRWSSVGPATHRRMLAASSVSAPSGSAVTLTWAGRSSLGDPGEPGVASAGVAIESDGKLRVGRAGLYLINLGCEASKFLNLVQLSSGSGVIGRQAGASAALTVAINTLVALAAGDFISASYTSGANGDTTSGFTLSIARLSD